MRGTRLTCLSAIKSHFAIYFDASAASINLFPISRINVCTFSQQAAEHQVHHAESLFPDRHPSLPTAHPINRGAADGERQLNWKFREIKYWRLTRASAPRGNQQTPTSCCLPFNYMSERDATITSRAKFGESRRSRDRKMRLRKSKNISPPHRKYFPFSSIASFCRWWWRHLLVVK